MKLKDIIQGEHKGEDFQFNKGLLEMFGRTWDREDIQILVETANLLHLEGHKLKVPTKRTKTRFDGMFGSYDHVDKIYEDDPEEK